ncbi:MAG TPA: hypothetical protein VIL09_16960 [Microvirga sp.]
MITQLEPAFQANNSSWVWLPAAVCKCGAFDKNAARAMPLSVVLRMFARSSPGGGMWMRLSGWPNMESAAFAGIMKPPGQRQVNFS